MIKLAIIIPTYNEEQNIESLVKEIKKIKTSNKIIIIDDSKNFLTKNIVKRKKLPVIYIKRNKKKGRGSAVLLGIKTLLKLYKIDTFLEMDADFSHNPREIDKKYKLFHKNKYDLLISSRYLPNSKIIGWPLRRKILSRMSNFLAKKIINAPVTDYTNGFRFYSRKNAAFISKNCGKIGDGFIILSEILMLSFMRGFKIYETPTVFVNRERGESSVNVSLIIKSLLGLFKIFLLKLSINLKR